MSNITNSAEGVPNSDKNKNSSSNKIVYSLIREFQKEGVLFTDQYGKPYLATHGDGTEVIPLESDVFRNYVNAATFGLFHRGITKNSVDKVIEVLKGEALFGNRRRVFTLDVRHSRPDEQTIWYDLGRYAVRMTGGDWRVVARPPILFKRFQHQKEQLAPEKGGSLELLHKYVNIEDECDWLMFQVFAVSCFIPGFPKPLLVQNGSQGSGKSTPLRMLKSLIDPSSLKSIPIPKTVSDLARIADHHSILFFDNLSKMPTDVSDSLCKLSTGDGFTKRRLYTDDDDVVYELQRPIMLNGINQIITQADLLDRSIPIELQRIPEEKRLTEEELWQSFNKDKPLILGAIFDIISKAVAIYPTVKLNRLPRMADFAKWGYAIAEAMEDYDGSDFISSYEIVVDRQNNEALNASPLAQFVIWLMRDKLEWHGTATELMLEHDSSRHKRCDSIELYRLSDSPMWPKDPASLGRSLNRISVNLKKVGFIIEKYTEANQRKIRILRDIFHPETYRYKFYASKIPETSAERRQFYEEYYDGLPMYDEPIQQEMGFLGDPELLKKNYEHYSGKVSK